MEKLKLGTRSRAGEQTCGYGVDDDLCSAPAKHHVLFYGSNQNCMACEEHMRFIQSVTTQNSFEIHGFGSNCGMPGALWHHPYEDEKEGYCFFPSNDDISALEYSETKENAFG